MNIKPAASVIVLREAPQKGMQVLLLRRADSIAFAGGLWVFPGGKIDAGDGDFSNNSLTVAASAAVREAQEEAGLQLDADNCLPYSYWLTPPGFNKRFSTYFFVTRAPLQAGVVVDGSEIVEHLWIDAAAALSRGYQGLPMMPPTYTTLLELQQCASIADFLSFVSSRKPPEYRPIMVAQEGVDISLYQGDSGYETADLSAGEPHHRLIFGKEGYQYIRPVTG